MAGRLPDWICRQVKAKGNNAPKHRVGIKNFSDPDFPLTPADYPPPYHQMSYYNQKWNDGMGFGGFLNENLLILLSYDKEYSGTHWLAGPDILGNSNFSSLSNTAPDLEGKYYSRARLIYLESIWDISGSHPNTADDWTGDPSKWKVSGVPDDWITFLNIIIPSQIRVGCPWSADIFLRQVNLMDEILPDRAKYSAIQEYEINAPFWYPEFNELNVKYWLYAAQWFHGANFDSCLSYLNIGIASGKLIPPSGDYETALASCQKSGLAEIDKSRGLLSLPSSGFCASIQNVGLWLGEIAGLIPTHGDAFRDEIAKQIADMIAHGSYTVKDGDKVVKVYKFSDLDAANVRGVFTDADNAAIASGKQPSDEATILAEMQAEIIKLLDSQQNDDNNSNKWSTTTWIIIAGAGLLAVSVFVAYKVS
jgi:hypothetical protein